MANTLETFFKPYKALNAYPGEVGLRGKSLIRRLLKDVKSKEECEWLLLKAYISMCYSAECIQHINRMNPQSEAQLYADISVLLVMPQGSGSNPDLKKDSGMRTEIDLTAEIGMSTKIGGTRIKTDGRVS